MAFTDSENSAPSTDSIDSSPDLNEVEVLVNTAGEEEREAFSRRWNALEGMGVMVLILVVLWPFGYVFGVLGDLDVVNVVANAILVLGGIFILCVAPFLHRDSTCSWGLGHPTRLWRLYRECRAAGRVLLAAVNIGLFLALIWATFLNWERILEVIGMDHSLLRDISAEGRGRLIVLAAGAIGSFFVVTFIIRYDNFLSAFRTALFVSVPLLVVVAGVAWLHRGAAAFSHLDPVSWITDVLRYVVWGFVQQLLFSAYFGTRLRKAFGPSSDPANTVADGPRWTPALLLGAIIMLGAYVLSLTGLNLAYGSRNVPWTLPIILALFVFPFGLVYGWYYGKDRKRLLVATLTGTCFGLIHIDSYFLVAVTFGLGIPLAYVFMEDRNRNLVALGFIHGLLGSTFGALFSEGQSGLLEVDYGVGPWNVEHPTPYVLIIPILCIAAYVGLMIWSARRLHDDT